MYYVIYVISLNILHETNKHINILI